jgi:hypothetical protein
MNTTQTRYDHSFFGGAISCTITHTEPKDIKFVDIRLGHVHDDAKRLTDAELGELQKFVALQQPKNNRQDRLFREIGREQRRRRLRQESHQKMAALEVAA